MSNSSIEFSVICIDNSDYMRNEDIIPNRFIAQKDAANIICHHILTTRVENRVGIVTLANEPQVIQPLTNNEFNVMRRLYGIQMKGEINLMSAIKLSIIALKQMSAKEMRTAKHRIIIFVGSPLKDDPKEFDLLIQKLKKSNICVDIISFGSEDGNKTKILESFVEKLNNSHLVNIPNNSLMTNVLAESLILSNSRNVSLINENMDPELALAMKMSVNQNNEQFDKDIEKAMQESAHLSQTPSSQSEEERELQKAIEMSLQFSPKNYIPNKLPKEQKSVPKLNNNLKTMKDDENLALSLQMSLLETHKQLKNQKKEEFMNSKKTNNSKEKNEDKKSNQNNKHSDN